MATTAELYARLDKGDDAIAAREKAGQPVPEKWLREWLTLLGEYERQVMRERAGDRARWGEGERGWARR